MEPDGGFYFDLVDCAVCSATVVGRGVVRRVFGVLRKYTVLCIFDCWCLAARLERAGQ